MELTRSQRYYQANREKILERQARKRALHRGVNITRKAYSELEKLFGPNGMLQQEERNEELQHSQRHTNQRAGYKNSYAKAAKTNGKRRQQQQRQSKSSSESESESESASSESGSSSEESEREKPARKQTKYADNRHNQSTKTGRHSCSDDEIEEALRGLEEEEEEN